MKHIKMTLLEFKGEGGSCRLFGAKIAYLKYVLNTTNVKCEQCKESITLAGYKIGDEGLLCNICAKKRWGGPVPYIFNKKE